MAVCHPCGKRHCVGTKTSTTMVSPRGRASAAACTRRACQCMSMSLARRRTMRRRTSTTRHARRASSHKDMRRCDLGTRETRLAFRAINCDLWDFLYVDTSIKCYPTEPCLYSILLLSSTQQVLCLFVQVRLLTITLPTNLHSSFISQFFNCCLPFIPFPVPFANYTRQVTTDFLNPLIRCNKFLNF